MAAMNGSGIDAALRSAAISAPLIVAAATSTLPQMDVAVGGALGTAAVLYGSRRARRIDTLKDSAVTYTFLMSRELALRTICLEWQTARRKTLDQRVLR